MKNSKLKEYKTHKQLREVLRNWRKIKKVVIRPADKGGAIVVLSKDYYNTELANQLGDINTYIKLQGNPTKEYKSELHELIQRGKMKNILSEKEEKYLIPDICRVPIIYTVPKIHKNQTHPPGRPIMEYNPSTRDLGSMWTILFSH